MTGHEVAKRVLEGEDPKKFLRGQGADREKRLGYYRQFIQSYAGTALWSSTDADGHPLDEYDVDDIDEGTFKQMEDDCIAFCDQNYDDISSDLEQAGHDFWLTRNGHGAGFWDGDWGDELGDKLTAASKAFGSFDLYVGDDGKIYGS